MDRILTQHCHEYRTDRKTYSTYQKTDMCISSLHILISVILRNMFILSGNFPNVRNTIDDGTYFLTKGQRLWQ